MNTSWQKYLGLGTQLIVGLVITLYLGKKVDELMLWNQFCYWIFPSAFILFTLYRIVKETQSK